MTIAGAVISTIESVRVDASICLIAGSILVFTTIMPCAPLAVAARSAPKDNRANQPLHRVNS